MKRICFLAGLMAGMLGWAGCDNQPKTATTPPAAATSNVVADAYPDLPTHAQTKLQTLQLWVGPKPISAELALTPDEEHTGMMFRTNMAENEGMLFVFPQPYRASFWMMNTTLPLSAAYIDPEGVIMEIHDLKPLDTNSVVAASENIQYVLETPQGWFERNKINVGTAVSTERGKLKSTFIFTRR